MYETNLHYIAAEALEKQEENDHFLGFIKRQDGEGIDTLVHGIYKEVNDAIDCTSCGNCCKTLVVNITPAEINGLADHLQMPVPELKERYIEESLQGSCYLNAIPCHFLDDKKCGIYAHRFTECRDFPHLHKPGFKERLLGTMLHYGSCPIIYNVIEEVKEQTGFVER